MVIGKSAITKLNMITIETLLNIVTYDFLKPMRNRNKEWGTSDKHMGLLPGIFFKINQNKPLTFSSAELAIRDLPSLYESVTLDSLDKPHMADALMHLKKMTGNKPLISEE